MKSSSGGDDLMAVVDEFHRQRAWADRLVAVVLRQHLHEIPKEQALWLRDFLRSHLSRREWKLIRDAWALPDRWPNHKPVDPSEIPF